MDEQTALMVEGRILRALDRCGPLPRRTLQQKGQQRAGASAFAVVLTGLSARDYIEVSDDGTFVLTDDGRTYLKTRPPVGRLAIPEWDKSGRQFVGTGGRPPKNKTPRTLTGPRVFYLDLGRDR